MTGYITSEKNAGRVLAKGKLTSLTAAFNLGGKPFSVLIVPVADVTEGVISNVAESIGLVVSCKCYAESAVSDLPIYFHTWTEADIVEIAADAIDLDDYDVYYGAGE
jgi:hypothetical protein